MADNNKYVKFKQGLGKDFNTTKQPLTDGMVYFVIDANNHGAIYYDTTLDGAKETKTGTLKRVRMGGLPTIKVTGSVTGTGKISDDGASITIDTVTNHSHGLMHQNFIVTLPNDDTVNLWTQLGNVNNGFWLKSVRGQAKAPNWFQPDYSAGIAFGGADTKGVISLKYSTSSVRFAGGNSTAPVWYFTITGANNGTYDLTKIGGNASSANKLNHNVTFKINPVANQTNGEAGVTSDLSGNALNLTMCARISGFENIQSTRFQGDLSGSADKVDGYHLNEAQYAYTNTYKQPTADATWQLKISTNNWNNKSETIYIETIGNNRRGVVILKVGSRQYNWWGYATQYNGVGINGVYKTIGNSDNVYIKIDSGVTSVVINTTFNPTIINATISDDYYTSVPSEGGFFSNSLYTKSFQASSGWFGNKYLSPDNWIGWYDGIGNLNSNRYGYIQNDISTNGNMHFRREQGGNFDFNGHLLPSAANTYDLGSSGASWRNLHIQNISLYGQTGNRLMWTNGSKAVQAGYHYADTTHVAINSTSQPSFNFYVNGTTGITGSLTVGNNAYINRNIILNSPSTEAGDINLSALGMKGNGYPVYADPEFENGKNGVAVYNNASNGTVTITRIDDSTSGNSTNKVLKITHTGSASPDWGGFVQNITSRANAVFVQIFRAKIPSGYKIKTASNSMGSGYQDTWITNNSGTGKWEWYARRVVCGKDGTFSSGGHVYLSEGTAPTSSAPVSWYLSYCNLYDLSKGAYDGLRTRYSDVATYASDDTSSPIHKRFISTLLINTSNGTTFSFKGQDGSGGDRPNMITIPNASSEKAGLITNADQTIAGEKTLTSNLRFANVSTGTRGIVGTIADNDYWRVVGRADSSNAGYLEIATGDDTNEPIYVRQYSGAFGTVARTLTLLDGSGNTTIPGNLTIKGKIIDADAQEVRAKFFVSSIKQKTSNGTTYEFAGYNTTGGELCSVTIPNASTTVAGLMTNASQTLSGDKTWYGKHVMRIAGSTTTSKSSILRLSGVPSDQNDDTYGASNAGLELWRGGNASWQIVNESGYLKFRTNWTSAKQSTYSVQSLQLNFGTGLAKAPYVSVNGENTSYRLYVNATDSSGNSNSGSAAAYFNGTTTHNGHVYLNQAYALYRVGRSSNWNQAHSNAMMIMSTAEGWSPFISQKASNGWWTLGHYTSDGYKDEWLFGYLANANVSGTTGASNSLSTIIRFKNLGKDQMIVTASNNSNKGSSATKPIYIDNKGMVEACSYSLSSTVNAGTANRMAYYSDANAISAAGHYVDSNKVAINDSKATTAGSLTFHFSVNGYSYLGGTTYVQKDFNIRGNESTDDTTHLRFLASDNTLRALISFNGNTDNTYNSTTHLKIMSQYGDIRLSPKSGSVNFCKSSIRNLAVGGGIYWDPYVESDSDASDAASITVIKSGIAGGTELRISQQNDATDVINLVAPSYIYLNSKKAFIINDTWLRINENNGFSDGVYFGQSIARTDNVFQVGSNGNSFYANNNGLTYIKDSLNLGMDRNNVNSTYRLNIQGGKLFYHNDGSLIIYTIENTQHQYGPETVAIQTCFDNADPSTHEYVTKYEQRCNLLLQPRGGQVYIGENMTTDGSTTFSLYVKGGISVTDGYVSLAPNRYTGPGKSFGLICNNSDIVGLNGLFTSDVAENFAEGYNFYRSNTTYDAMAAKDGVFYFGSNVSFGAGLDGTATINAGYGVFNNNVAIGSSIKSNYKLYVKGTSWVEGDLWSDNHKPNASNTYSLGNSQYIWKEAYINRVYGTTTNANKVWNDSVYMSFHWEDNSKSGQPTHLWGGNSSGDMYVYNPSNFSVNYANSAGKLSTARTISLTGSVTGSGSFDGSGNLTIATTTNHTHNYAGSSSAGGAANSANKLNTNAGSSTKPIYFSNGIPIQCNNTLEVSITGNAATASNADKLDNYHASTVYQAATYAINNYSSTNDWIRIATIKIDGTNLAMGGFTAILSNRECLDSSSFILTIAIRRNSTSSVGCQAFYTPIGSSSPRQILIRSNDGVNFYVYFKSELNSWTTYYNVTKIMTENNVTFENAGVASSSLIAGSVLNITASRGGYVNQAISADSSKKVYNDSTNMAFHWSGQNGQPTWLWGGNDQNNMYVYNPSNFSVNYANSAGNAKSLYLKTSTRESSLNYNLNSSTYQNKITYSLATSSITDITKKPLQKDAFIITFGWDNNGWGSQLAMTSNGTKVNHMAIRSAISDSNNNNVSSWGDWITLLDSSNYTSYVNNYYWANIKVSTSSNTGTSPTFSTVYTSNWYRSTGSTGWYNETHKGGIYMTDDTWVRIYNSKKFYVSNTAIDAIYTSGGVKANTGWFGNKYLSSDNWIGWYTTHGDSSSTRYGYIRTQLAANGQMQFVKEQGGSFSFNSSVYVTDGAIRLNHASNEQQFLFEHASKNNHTAYLYKGSNTSSTIIGVYDGTDGSVWLYNTSGKLALNKTITLSTGNYGSSLPSSGTNGQIFFKI